MDQPVKTVLRAVALLLVVASCVAPAIAQSSRRFPDILVVTVDTLRSDRLSGYGYSRPTSPNLDRLMAEGVRFTEARVAEPLTAPSMTSMLTSLHPHQHGASRNGLRMRSGLESLPKILKRRRYRSVAFVSNWTLRDEISGLAEHFDEYHEIFTRKRWYVFAAEADGDDVTEAALDWLEEHVEDKERDPVLLWVHYVEPHEPYRFHEEFAEPLGIERRDNVPISDRYDTEVAFVDRAVGHLLEGVDRLLERSDTLILFTSDHGESLGEHDYWGHGRHLWEPTLHIPMSLTWRGRLGPRTLDAPASLLDVAPTVFGLLGLPIYPGFDGYDWTPVLLEGAEPPMDRVTYHQAHKGAVQRAGNQQARRQGLLEVARVENGRKEILRIKNDHRRLYDLPRDRKELRSLVAQHTSASDDLARWLEEVREGLAAADHLPPAELDDEAIDKLRALGYID